MRLLLQGLPPYMELEHLRLCIMKECGITDFALENLTDVVTDDSRQVTLRVHDNVASKVVQRISGYTIGEYRLLVVVATEDTAPRSYLQCPDTPPPPFISIACTPSDRPPLPWQQVSGLQPFYTKSEPEYTQSYAVSGRDGPMRPHDIPDAHWSIGPSSAAYDCPRMPEEAYYEMIRSRERSSPGGSDSSSSSRSVERSQVSPTVSASEDKSSLFGAQLQQLYDQIATKVSPTVSALEDRSYLFPAQLQQLSDQIATKKEVLEESLPSNQVLTAMSSLDRPSSPDSASQSYYRALKTRERSPDKRSSGRSTSDSVSVNEEKIQSDRISTSSRLHRRSSPYNRLSNKPRKDRELSPRRPFCRFQSSYDKYRLGYAPLRRGRELQRRRSSRDRHHSSADKRLRSPDNCYRHKSKYLKRERSRSPPKSREKSRSPPNDTKVNQFLKDIMQIDFEDDTEKVPPKITEDVETTIHDHLSSTKTDIPSFPTNVSSYKNEISTMLNISVSETKTLEPPAETNTSVSQLKSPVTETNAQPSQSHATGSAILSLPTETLVPRLNIFTNDHSPLPPTTTAPSHQNGRKQLKINITSTSLHIISCQQNESCPQKTYNQTSQNKEKTQTMLAGMQGYQTVMLTNEPDMKNMSQGIPELPITSEGAFRLTMIPLPVLEQTIPQAVPQPTMMPHEAPSQTMMPDAPSPLPIMTSRIPVPRGRPQTLAAIKRIPLPPGIKQNPNPQSISRKAMIKERAIEETLWKGKSKRKKWVKESVAILAKEHLVNSGETVQPKNMQSKDYISLMDGIKSNIEPKFTKIVLFGKPRKMTSVINDFRNRYKNIHSKQLVEEIAANLGIKLPLSGLPGEPRV